MMYSIKMSELMNFSDSYLFFNWDKEPNLSVTNHWRSSICCPDCWPCWAFFWVLYWCWILLSLPPSSFSRRASVPSHPKHAPQPGWKDHRHAVGDRQLRVAPHAGVSRVSPLQGGRGCCCAAGSPGQGVRPEAHQPRRSPQLRTGKNYIQTVHLLVHLFSF